MKKNIGFILICLALFTTVNARENCTENCGWYVGGFGGANWLNIKKVDGVTIDTNVGFNVSGAVGYKLPTATRIEAEIAYRNNRINHLKFRGQKWGVGGHAISTSYMANVYQDINYFRLLATPYIGIGAGYTHIKDTVCAGGHRFKGSDDGFAWQVMAGFDMPFTRNSEIGIEYRYFQGRSDAFDHSVGVAFRGYFY